MAARSRRAGCHRCFNRRGTNVARDQLSGRGAFVRGGARHRGAELGVSDVRKRGKRDGHTSVVFTLAARAWRSESGERISVIGPVQITPGTCYAARMESIEPPGVSSLNEDQIAERGGPARRPRMPAVSMGEERRQSESRRAYSARWDRGGMPREGSLISEDTPLVHDGWLPPLGDDVGMVAADIVDGSALIGVPSGVAAPTTVTQNRRNCPGCEGANSSAPRLLRFRHVRYPS
jgi:hypothetical protein